MTLTCTWLSEFSHADFSARCAWCTPCQVSIQSTWAEWRFPHRGWCSCHQPSDSPRQASCLSRSPNKTHKQITNTVESILIMIINNNNNNKHICIAEQGRNFRGKTEEATPYQISRLMSLMLTLTEPSKAKYNRIFHNIPNFVHFQCAKFNNYSKTAIELLVLFTSLLLATEGGTQLSWPLNILC